MNFDLVYVVYEYKECNRRGKMWIKDVILRSDCCVSFSKTLRYWISGSVATLLKKRATYLHPSRLQAGVNYLPYSARKWPKTKKNTHSLFLHRIRFQSFITKILVAVGIFQVFRVHLCCNTHKVLSQSLWYFQGFSAWKMISRGLSKISRKYQSQFWFSYPYSSFKR